MKFERLRLTGFKSFCDTAEFKIEPGLTGVVGPNGCGKSNLVEALRWVMGESSFKAMRASGMDDVIFAGSGKRPSRNNAEVGILLDNADRRAPAAFNEHETIEVTRRIERESGSTYRVNGREVRARDVQLLFADASTGARSPALVRQGQIGEIIAAKPQARRLILEEAAGISGLHSRRHEAELRLKGAEDNLLRVEDVLKQIDVQVESLKRQARQSSRYRNLAADIRRNEALAHLIAWREAETAFAEAAKKLDADLLDVAERTRAQGEAARLQALAAAELPALREEEARRAAALQRITLARDALEAEEKRAGERAGRARAPRRPARPRPRARAGADRRRGLGDRAARSRGRDPRRGARRRGRCRGRRPARGRTRPRRRSPPPRPSSTRRRPPRPTSTRAVMRSGPRRRRRGGVSRGSRPNMRESSASSRRSRGDGFEDAEHERRAEAAAELAEALEAAEQATLFAEEKHAEAREAEALTRAPLAEAERKAQALETEARTLAGLLGARADDRFAPVVDAISVARGYEAALGAALGDDLDAPTDEAAPAHWSLLPGFGGDPKLPDGVAPLAAQVTAPPALARRLAQVGVVRPRRRRAARRPSSKSASGSSRARATSGAGTASSPPRRRRPPPRGASPKRTGSAISNARPRPPARRPWSCARRPRGRRRRCARPPPPRPNGATGRGPPAPPPMRPAPRSANSSASALRR